MTDVLAALFVTPIHLTGIGRLMLMLPLCLAISIIYKATRCDRLEEIPGAVASLWVTIVIGMFAVGVGLWAFYLIMA